MENVHWKGILESLLFAAGDEGLSLKQIRDVLEMETYQAEELIHSLKEDYEQDNNRGLIIVELAGTYQLATKKAHTNYLKKLVESPNVSGLSQAALETLAIVAYKQPITRVEIEDIRGVKTERPIHNLVAKGLIKEVGRVSGPGRAILYGTSKEFLDYFGLRNIEELPQLAETLEGNEEQADSDLFFEKFQETLANTSS